jgi:redox-sensitive bicupin YhaK (pirin superfamily)
VHEGVPAETGKTVHSLQIFVNLPTELQEMAPSAQSLEPHEIPVVQLPGIKVRVPLGRYGEVCLSLVPPTDVTLLDISFQGGRELRVPRPIGHTAFVLPIYGTVMVNGKLFNPDNLELPIMPAQTLPDIIKLYAVGDNVKVVLYSGTPLNPIMNRPTDAPRAAA